MLDLIIAAALAQGSPAPQWRSVHRAEAGEVFVDPASLRRDGDNFEIETRAVFDQVTPSGMKIGLSRQRYNCARQSWMAVHARYLGPDGRVLHEGAPVGALARDRPAGGGSANAAILNLYCPPRRAG